MSGFRRYDWQAASGVLHGIRIGQYRPCPHDEPPALCGAEIVLTREDFRRDTRTRMCTACLDRWNAELSAS
ncbi:hypothetical protein [Actinokineospora sp.]|uniref:hypothetical protein n=1 Tax=Actinokineospora sp. TaxID=1872133 RepID=UPI003D6C44AB